MVYLDGCKKSYYDMMSAFMSYINTKSDKFVLKGSTALLMCYNLDRFSEDLDFDGFDDNFFSVVNDFADYMNRKGYNLIYRKTIISNHDSVVIHYGGYKPLKINVFYRKKCLYTNELSIDNDIIKGIRVYSINSLFSMKMLSFMDKSTVYDLYDLVFMYNNYYHNIGKSLIYQLRDLLAYRGSGYFYFIIKGCESSLIDTNKLLKDFTCMYKSLDLNN